MPLDALISFLHAILPCFFVFLYQSIFPMETTEHIDGPEELEPNRDTAKRKPTKGRKDVASRKRQYILEDGQGRLFIAKDSSNGRPALRGTIQIDGKRYDMSGWYQPMRNRKDTKYINLRLREQSDPADNPIQDMLEGKL